jgi:nucleoside-diphosphate-sugar epimerase
MKVLVTGAAGFLGSRVVRRLLEHGARDIRCFVRAGSRQARIEALRRDFPDAAIEIFVGNLTSKDDCCRAVEGVGSVYHLAAGMAGSAPDMFTNTVVASRNLLNAIGTAPIRVVLVSSFVVYHVAALKRLARVDEGTPLEPDPQRRDPYTYAKLRQEQLFREYQQKSGFDLVVLRPGVIYGPGGAPFSLRVGLNVAGIFFHLGGRNPLPLTYVENCAEAIVVAGQSPDATGRTFNVHDDQLPTARTYLREYRRHVKRIRKVTLPYRVTIVLARLLERYHHRSQGQIPAVLTPYKVASLWKRTTFGNAALKTLGWKQLVSTDTGLRETFAYLQSQLRPES